MEKSNKEKFLDLVSDNDSKYMERHIFRIKNRYWLKHSTQIAIGILTRMDYFKYSKEDLSILSEIDIETINKMVKGEYNFDLRQISKLSSILGTELLIFK